MDKIEFTETRTRTLKDLYEKWTEIESYFRSEEYNRIIDGIKDSLSLVKIIDFRLDEWSGNASVVMEHSYFAPEKEKMRHVIKELQENLEVARGMKYYYHNGKRRESKILAKDVAETCPSGYTIEVDFWEIFAEDLDTLTRKYYRCNEEISIIHELTSFYHEVLNRFMRVFVKAYRADLSEENFLEQLPEQYPEVWEQVKEQLSK